MSLIERVNGLIEHMKTGKILEAMEAFYADNTSMQENSNAPTVGLAANIEREKQFLASVKEWKSLSVSAVAVEETGPDSGVAFIEYDFDFISTEDQPVRYEQVTVQHWNNGKIERERFYHE
ncbi:MAG: nuclear transport factor 2 family protein [Planctomycetota bacterium]